MTTNWIHYSKLTPTAIEPEYKTTGAAGLDLYADEERTIACGQTAIVATGIAIELPPGTMAQIVPRSGLSRRGVVVATGTIDSDYRGGLGVIVTNLKPSGHDHTVRPGDRIAQLVIQPVITAVLRRGDLSETVRGAGGFGSTGK